MTNQVSELVRLATILMHCPSVTPVTAGVFDIIEAYLVPLGFTAHRQTFGEGAAAVENLYVRYGTQAPNFCFAGHTDVVPPGDESTWKVPPFSPRVIDGELYGRGAEDMKGAVASFMFAAKQFVQKPFSGSVSMLITQDEEGQAVNGTKPMLKWLQERGEKIDYCIVGEPTNPDILGEMVKIGRRGSAYFTLTVNGKQGHVAYPERADNPNTRLINMLHALKTEKIDAGSEFFPPSNLEVSSIDVGNPTGNVIPATATAKFSIRFNDRHTGVTITAWVQEICARVGGNFTLTPRVTGEAFLTRDEKLIAIVASAVEEVTGRTPVLSTTGGTSDARFIKDVCPVVEFGTTGRTPHMVDERVEVKTLEGLSKVYLRILERFFK